MPTTEKKAPSTLPDAAKNIYVSVFNSAYDGTCSDRSDRDACASKIAWSAVKEKYKKDGDEWIKKAELSHFEFWITKAGIDPESGEKRWACVASDTGKDQLNDEMHKSLFDSFLHRIKSNVQVPPAWQSDFWKGGMPYMSLSHYSDINGMALPGDVSSVYLDGDLLKAKGIFADTLLGEASYKAVRESYQKTKSGTVDDGFQPVRISIGFLDYKHKHKSNGYMFERKSFEEGCPECRKEFVLGLEGQERQGVIYQDGQLIHLALTRVPVNQRTYIGLDAEVNRAMTTRKEDAASIVGEELAEEIEELEAKEGKMPKKALVTKSEEEAEIVTKTRYYTMEDGMTSMERGEAVWKINDIFGLLSEVVWNITYYGNEDYPTSESMKRAVNQALEDASEMMTARGLLVMKNLNLTENGKLEADVHPLDQAYEALKAKYEKIDKSDVKNLEQLQGEFNALAEVMRSEFSGKGTAETDDEPVKVEVNADEIKKSILGEISPVLEQITLSLAELKDGKKDAGSEVRRGVTAPTLVVNDPKNNHPEKPKKQVTSFTQIANRSVGLDPLFSGRSEAKAAKNPG
jgi:cation transport regulator